MVSKFLLLLIWCNYLTLNLTLLHEFTAELNLLPETAPVFRVL